ncbi:MAG TPA: hypothetical protein VMS86_03160, partial [Thermoanaerobaculia bacterium]|nr:hypothetical protein [Thermoanaerobaculia bacterium]
MSPLSAASLVPRRSAPAGVALLATPPAPAPRRAPGRLALAALVASGCAREATLPQPGSYELHPALEIELWAAEPAVLDPVALTFDAAERMY